MDNRVHDALHSLASATQKVQEAFKEWEEEVTKFYLLVEDICNEKEKEDGNI